MVIPHPGTTDQPVPSSPDMLPSPETRKNARAALLESPARRRAAGFTLIELMITVAIVVTLMSVALPSYQEHLRKSRRAEAQAYMMAVATRQQQFLVDTRAYATTLTAVGVAVPASVDSAYTLAMPAPGVNPPSFTITLTPKTAQTSERCGTLTLDAAGTKGASAPGCW